jgi:hypothetical protein
VQVLGHQVRVAHRHGNGLVAENGLQRWKVSSSLREQGYEVVL